jgi:hypothetical protein
MISNENNSILFQRLLLLLFSEDIAIITKVWGKEKLFFETKQFLPNDNGTQVEPKII